MTLDVSAPRGVSAGSTTADMDCPIADARGGSNSSSLPRCNSTPVGSTRDRRTPTDTMSPHANVCGGPPLIRSTARGLPRGAMTTSTSSIATAVAGEVAVGIAGHADALGGGCRSGSGAAGWRTAGIGALRSCVPTHCSRPAPSATSPSNLTASEVWRLPVPPNCACWPFDTFTSRWCRSPTLVLPCEWTG